MQNIFCGRCENTVGVLQRSWLLPILVDLARMVELIWNAWCKNDTVVSRLNTELFNAVMHTSRLWHWRNTDQNSTPALQWRHNGRVSVSNHQPHHCLLKRLFRRRSKKTSKLRVTGLCEGNSPGTGEFPAEMASNAENVSIWWRHHEKPHCSSAKANDELLHMRLQWCHMGAVTCQITGNSPVYARIC